MVTPAGLLVTRPVPSTSTGPSVREMVLGSEGRLGIITEATVQVPPLPPERTILGYLFPSWARVARRDARHRGQRGGAVGHARRPTPTRRAFSFATQQGPDAARQAQVDRAQDVPRARQGLRPRARCASAFIGYEGSERHVEAQRKAVGQIVERHGGLCIGSSPGELYDQKKFDTPYIRDFLLDRGVLADVSETAAPWSELGRSTTA